MTVTAFVPMGGSAGWAYLKRTMDAQKRALANDPEARRLESAVRDRMGSVTSAEDLLQDRALLKVSLEAYGLGDDLRNRAFIRRILTDGTLDDGDLANRLSDKRYRDLSRDFGFGDFDTPSTQISDFADRLINRWREARFEMAVGEVAPEIRLALSAARELPRLAARGLSATAGWYTVMGNRPLAQVVRAAFNLPESAAALPVERQAQIYSEKARTLFGEPGLDQFSDPVKVEKLIHRYLNSAGGTGITPYNPALAILTG